MIRSIIIALTVFFATFFSGFTATSQPLQPGFDIDEYIELLALTSKHTDSTKFPDIPYPKRFKRHYLSPSVGLDNAWELWSDGRGTGVISIRGTTPSSESWLANLYAAMVPAKGQLKIGENQTFDYHLSDNPKAAVHVGWLLSTAFLCETMIPKIDSCYRAGITNFYIVGHSQGGGISFLLTAHLNQLQKDKLLSDQIRFKTYCSAAPKPGNLFFAYDYEALTQAGWAFNVVNSSDWVPEVPLSIQKTDDFNTANPFWGVKYKLKNQKFPKNIVLKHVYNKLDKPTRKAQKNYEKYLGVKAAEFVQKSLPDFEPPAYYPSNHYVRTGRIIVLTGDTAYFKKFPTIEEKIWIHHGFDAYYDLAVGMRAHP